MIRDTIACACLFFTLAVLLGLFTGHETHIQPVSVDPPVTTY